MTQNNKLPKEWEIKKLGEVCDEIFAGGDVPKNNFSKVKNDEFQVPIFANGEKNLGLYGYTNIIKVNSPALTISGRGTIGFSVVRLKPFFPIVRLLVLKPNVNTNLKYLKYSIDNCNIKHTGSSIPQLTVPAIKSLKISIPSLKSQEAIVFKIEELFSELDKGIEDLKTAQQQLKIYRQSVLKCAFEGKLTNKKVKEGQLPKGWEWKKIKDISKVVRGGSPRPAGDPKYYDGNIPFLKVADLTKDNGIYLTTFKYTIKEAGLHKTRHILPNTLLLSNSGATLGVPKICMISATMNDGVAAFLELDERSNHYLYYFWVSKTLELRGINMGAGQPNLNTDLIKDYQLPYCSFKEQHQIVQEIESRLSVADKMEESIAQSLQQAAALRQSILKKAFSGELVKEVVQEKVYKSKNQYFFQMQIIGKVASISKKNKIDHGEMTIAKYTYLADKLFGIPTGFEFNRWHLGPYPPAIKKVVNNKQYFQRRGNHIEVINESTLFKSTNDYSVLIDAAVSNLVNIFSKYKTPAERAHKTELLATVCKVIEDIKTTDLSSVRTSMKEWKIDLKTSTFKNKAEKFNEDETKSCIGFIIDKGWNEKLI